MIIIKKIKRKEHTHTFAMLKFIYAIAAVATVSTQAVNISYDTLYSSGSAAGAPKTCTDCNRDYRDLNYNYHAW